MKNLKVLALNFLIIALILNCSSSQKMTSREKSTDANEKSTGIINEFFDPLILDEEDLKLTRTISIESKSDQVNNVLSRVDDNEQTSEVITGYRVQICAVSDEEKARQVQRDAILKFVTEDVYLIYDTPYYKVRVGNCATRLEADQLQQLAVQNGFDDAWVVRTKVKSKTSSSSSQINYKKDQND
jgi:hypothetical protein